MFSYSIKKTVRRIFDQWLIFVISVFIGVIVSAIGENIRHDRAKWDAVARAKPKASAYIAAHCTKTKILSDGHGNAKQTIYVCFNDTREYEYNSIINLYLENKFKLASNEVLIQ